MSRPDTSKPPTSRAVRESARSKGRGKTVLLAAIIGASLLFIAGGALLIAAMMRTEPPPQPVGPLLSPAPTPPGPGPARPPTATTTLDEEKLAKGLFEAAESFAAAGSDTPDLALAKFRAVSTAYPSTSWAAKARERGRLLEEDLKALYEREFESLRLKSEGLARSGDVAGALAAIDAYLAGNPRDVLRRRAAVERVVIENDHRVKFNEAVAVAGGLAKKGAYDEAAALFDAMAKRALPEVAAACREEIERLKSARAAAEEWRLQQAARDAEAKVRVEAAKIPELAKAHRFDDAIAALREPPSLKQSADDERAALKAAGEFWKAVETGVKARAGAEISVKLGDGKRAAGKLSKITADGFTLGDQAVAFADLHDDQLLLFAMGKGGLAEGSGESYLRAAMYFYFTGKDPLAKIELATAKELGADIERFERVWRAGLVRSAISK